MQHIELNDQQVSEFYASPDYDLTHFDVSDWNLKLNEYVIFNSGPTLLGAAYFNGGYLEYVKPIVLGEGKDRFSPLNMEQRCYFDLLSREHLPIKICVGKAGTGKTKAALKFGFKKVFDSQSPIAKILLVREPIGLGERIGFFKGGKDEKIAMWNNPARDNLDPSDTQHTFDELIAKNIIEVDIPSLMQGRDLKNCWIIVDEAQNLTKQQFKMIGERVAVNTQIIFIGDGSQIVNGKFECDNGLARSLTLEGQSPLMGMVKLIDDVRSPVSKFFADTF